MIDLRQLSFQRPLNFFNAPTAAAYFLPASLMLMSSGLSISLVDAGSKVKQFLPGIFASL
jgi:hypothetical protein